ncbi:DNA primase large subunit-like isoform X3 [Agrilus planipennis]|uniref:DNA primase large subunit-like isoform X3 n=1 Tax=Agrilus planipennis TaxID=224129 RepID=A0A1W4WNA4_AGRPL|nr:DNA primase large subunit-like isoform X3 [Agrilus planipennis]
MDLEGSTSRRNKKVFYNLLEIYPHDLQFFADPPHLDLPIDEFEKLAMERMHVLRIIQQASSVKGHQLLSNGWVNCISEALKEFRLNDYNLIIMNCGSAQSEASCAVRRRDHISHYILRLVYCRSEELRRWFLARETELFNLKCKMLKEEEIDKFLSFNKLNLSPISQQEKGDLRISLLYSTKNFNFDTDFYKVQFSDVPYLVKKKQVLLKDGFAIIPKKDLIHYIANNFKKMLRQALLMMIVYVNCY